MRITNKAGLPQPIVDAVTNDPYDRGDCDISVTQLVGPPQIRRLIEYHADEIEEDAADRIWALLGQSVHHIIQRAQGRNDLQETRLFMTLGNYTISGQLDNYDTESKIITDYKLTSVYKLIKGVDPDWKMQLNFLAELVRQNGGEVLGLQIIGLARDWSVLKAKRERDFPQSQVVVMPVKLLESDVVLSQMEERLFLHFGRTHVSGPGHPRIDGDSVSCSNAERWARPDTWAVMKKGRKTAVRVLNAETDALAYIDNNGNGLSDYIEFRPGANVRCESYCPVANFCPQFRQIQEAQKEV